MDDDYSSKPIQTRLCINLQGNTGSRAFFAPVILFDQAKNAIHDSPDRTRIVLTKGDFHWNWMPVSSRAVTRRTVADSKSIVPRKSILPSCALANLCLGDCLGYTDSGRP